MAYGRPVVATAVGGLADAIENGETGLVVAPHDVVALRAAVRKLLADAALRERLGTAARRSAREHFGRAQAAVAILAAYRES
jgi:glycosyltransferase involved in cell wall biosynthesis